MNNTTALPSNLHRKVLLWLGDYALTPMMRLVAGKSLSSTIKWYHHILTSDMNRWSDNLKLLGRNTDDKVSMMLIGRNTEAAFVYRPQENTEINISLEHLLAPLATLAKNYRRDYVVELARSMGLPRQMVSLLGRCDDTDNALRLVITKEDSEYPWLEQLIDAAFIEQNLKQEKKLVKLGIPLHKMNSSFLFKTGFRGLYFQFNNNLNLQLYSEDSNWNGYLVLIAEKGEWEAEERFRKELEALELPEPIAEPKVDNTLPVSRPDSSKNTFLLGGQTLTAGDKLTIITPELGTLIAATTIQLFSHNLVVGLELTPLLFVTNCVSKLSFYSNGKGYHTLQLAYLCGCGHNVHRRYMEWSNLEIDGTTIRATEAARPDKVREPLKLPTTKELEAEPEVPVVVEPEPDKLVKAPKKVPQKPDGRVGNHGQYTMF